MKKVSRVVSFTLILGAVSSLWAQDAGNTSNTTSIAQIPSPLSLVVQPAVGVPIGASSQWFSLGGMMNLGVTYRIPQSVFYLGGGLDYEYSPVKAATSISLAALSAGGGAVIPLTGGVSLFAGAHVGYYFATYNDFSLSVTDPVLSAGVGMKLALSPTLSIRAGGAYENYLSLYQGVSIGAGMDVALGNLGGTVDIPSVHLDPAFPVFYKHYDDHPVGTLKIKSNLKVPATDITTRFFIKEYMDAAKVVVVPGTLLPGKTETLDLYALFNDKVLSVTEGTKVAAEITVAYKVGGTRFEDRTVQTLTLLGRNAMTWDDNRKAAAYVTAKDPGVLNFARSISSYVRSKENRAISDKLLAAIAFHEAVNLYGINYTRNPKIPYEEASTHKDVVDFLQFPRETFRYKAGDCSDLSILYAALFQAVGIDAAFVTVPGHIFVAVDTGLSPQEAPRELIPQGHFISYKNEAWIPMEVTSVHDGFMAAWNLGAKEWAESSRTGKAGFYPIQQAWQVYQPVGLPGQEATVSVPQSDAVLAAYRREVKKYLDTALEPEIQGLEKQVRGGENVPAMNRLAVLYAKYGQLAKAEAEFLQILQHRAYLPAILNLGHLYFEQGEWQKALTYYTRASSIAPNNPSTLLALARANQELQNYDSAKKEYEKLKKINPTLANRFAFLGGGNETGARAAEVSAERRMILWESGD